MIKQSYQNYDNAPEFFPEVPIKDWKSLAKQVEIKYLHSKKLTGSQLSINEIIDGSTPDWSSKDRERFKHWFQHTYNIRASAVGETSMRRFAFYPPHGATEVQQTFDKQRLSIVKRIRKLENEISQLYRSTAKTIEWSDPRYPTSQAKLEAIQGALHQVSVLLDALHTKEVTAAVLMRTARVLHGIDSDVGKKFAEVVGHAEGIVAIASSNEVAQIAADLKKELDIFNYGLHLRKMYNIYERLGKLGMTSLQEEVEELIQKDLTDISSIFKALSGIHSALLKIPNEETVEVVEEPSVPAPTKPQAQDLPKQDPHRVPLAETFKAPPPKAPAVPAVDIA
jgi:hypothetical protein